MAKKSLVAALAIITAGAIALPEIAISAPMPQPSNSAAEIARDVKIEPAATYWRKKRYGYNQRWHGNRYRYRHGGYRHYYNGWYYASPWWLAGPLVAGAIIAPRVYDNSYYDNGGYGGGHVQWCLNRYRSYDPRSNTFLGYDGYRHECNGPY